MEIWEVLAIDKNCVLYFKAEDKKIPGIKLLLRDPNGEVGEQARYLGFVWFEQFLSNDRLSRLKVLPQVGDLIRLVFNRHGDIASIEVIASAG